MFTFALPVAGLEANLLGVIILGTGVGILGGLLGVGRAVGETMAVWMASGGTDNILRSPASARRRPTSMRPSPAR